MFDIHKLSKNRQKVQNFLQDSPFHKFLQKDLIERLSIIDKTFKNVLILNSPNPLILKKFLKIKSSKVNIILNDFTKIDSINGKFDLIIFPFTMHWVDDIPKFLTQIKAFLNDDGIFICNFIGAGSIMNLRKKLIEIESIYQKKHIPHISPFVNFDQMSSILQHAGFEENIIDMENIEFEYDSAIDWMKAIKKAGESNILTNGISYSITKKIYNSLKQQSEKTFKDKINLISFISAKIKNNINLTKQILPQ